MRNNGRFTATDEMIALGGGELFEPTEHTKSGFMFGMRIFAPVFLTASFFFMGPGTAKAIFGDIGKGLPFAGRGPRHRG